MIIQMAFGDKKLGTDLALKFTVVIVRLEVDIQISLLSEFVSTKRARVGLDAKMLSDVNLQTRFLWITDSAYCTFIGFYFIMIKFMSFHMTFSFKLKTALREPTLKRPLFMIRFLLNLHIQFVIPAQMGEIITSFLFLLTSF